MPAELDFEREAANTKRCREMFKDNMRVAVPKVYDKYTYSRVLTMSFETGLPLTKVKEMHQSGIDLRSLAQLISQTFMHMIFKEGFIHADPHPGNIFVRKLPGGDSQLVLLDHGIYTELPTETRLSYTKLWRGILAQDEAMIKQASSDLGCDFH